MAGKLEFTLRQDKSETGQGKSDIDLYRRSWTPDADVSLAGMWIGAVLTDKNGESYFGCRGLDDFVPGMTHLVLPICGFRKLRKSLEAGPPHLFPEYTGVDFFEPMSYQESEEGTKLAFDLGRVERDGDGMHWYDASGRWEMHGKTISDAVTIQVPQQEGVEKRFQYRHELLKITGKIGDIEVEGHLHHDYAYGPPGSIYSELPIARHLQGMWVSWVHEYADGEVGGGHFWQGRDGLNFGPGYVLDRGVTTTHSDIVAKPTVNEKGQLTALEATIGGETYSFAFDMGGSPIHFFGNLVGRSSREAPVRSWCWVEYPEGKLNAAYLDIGVRRVQLARSGGKHAG